MGSEMITGDLSSPGSGTFVCATTDWEKPDDYFNEWREGYDYSGTSVGTSFKPTDWDNGTHTMTFLPAVTLTNGDSVEMHRIWTVAEINDAINLAIESIAHNVFLNLTDEVTCLDSILSDGFFNETTITTYWAADANSTLTRDTTYYKSSSPAASAKLVTDGTNVGYITQSYTNYAEIAGQTVRAKAWVWTTTADRVCLRVKDGVTTTDSDDHDGEGWQELEVNSFSIDDAATEFTVQIYVTAGAAVTFYAQCIWCAGDHIYEYNLDTNFVTVNKIELEQTTNDRDVYSLVPNDYWHILKEGTARIQLVGWTPTAGRRLRIHGMASPAGLSADSTQCAINPDYIANYAAMRLHQGRMSQGGPEAEWHKSGYSVCEREVQKLIPSVIRSLPPGSRWVIE